MTSNSRLENQVFTRSRDNFWLIVNPIAFITGNKLSSKLQVHPLFFHHQRVLHKPVHDSAREVTKGLVLFWEKAQILITQERIIILKVENLFSLRGNVQKRNMSRKGAQIKKVIYFLKDLSTFFDIVHANAMNL